MQNGSKQKLTSIGAKGCCFSFVCVYELVCVCVCVCCFKLNSSSPTISLLPLYRPIFHGQLKPRTKQSSPWAAATRRPTRTRATTYCRRTTPSPGLIVVWLITPPARVHSVRSKLLVSAKMPSKISVENKQTKKKDNAKEKLATEADYSQYLLHLFPLSGVLVCLVSFFHSYRFLFFA